MWKNLSKIILLILLALPSEAIALYLERTYFMELGFIVSVFLTYLLSLLASLMRSYKIWAIGNLLLIATSYLFLQVIGFEILHIIPGEKFPMLLLIFLLCRVTPQIFGYIWGRILRQSTSKEQKYLTKTEISKPKQSHTFSTKAETQF
ncbi:MAG: hypothetical protein LBV67_04370 [Streptococcaceae bacterium]|jgi:hypothetical protein|nr:hypothetical protein [Streptococcaceae bacterium]